VRYRGLAKNTSRALTALALANIYLARHRTCDVGVNGAAGNGAKQLPDHPLSVPLAFYERHWQFAFL